MKEQSLRDYLMELFLEYGERDFPFRESSTKCLFAQARGENFIEVIPRINYTEYRLPYKLTAKALEYIKTND